MSDHSLFSPSQLSRILSCPASASAVKVLSTSSYAEEGTLLHHVVEQGLFTHLRGQSWATKIRSFGLSLEQVSLAEECILYALDKAKGIPNCEWCIEKRVYIVKDCDGTPDLVLHNSAEVHVIDWKFGAGVEVSAQDNTQLMAYAAGALKDLGMDGSHLPVYMHVVQPRLNNYDTFMLTARDLDRWVNHVLITGLEEARKPDAPYHPSVEACRWCPRKNNCPARVEQAFKQAEEVFSAYAQMPEIPVDRIAELIAKAEEVEQCIKDLKLHATKLLMDGKEVPHLKLVRGRSNRMWADEAAAGEFLSTYLDPEEMFTMKMVSPTQAEKLLDRDLRKDESFLSLVHKPEGKPTLVPESDKRQAISGDASCVFANYTEEE